MQLQKSSSPDVVFIASRILFLATASSATAGSFIVSIVERKPSGRAHSLVEILSLRLESLTTALLSGTKMAREAIVDLLKFTFNILTHYPKVCFVLFSLSLSLICYSSSNVRKSLRLAAVTTIAKSWESTGPIGLMGSHNDTSVRFLTYAFIHSLLPPLLRAFNTLQAGSSSPLAPPLNHVIHALLTIPFTKNLQSTWLPPTTPRSRRGSPTSGPASPVSPSGSSLASDPPREPSRHHGAFDLAKSMLSAGRRSLSRSSSPARPPSPPNRDTLQHAFGLLEVALSHYFPGTVEPDDASVRATAKAESDSTLDELLPPLVMLLCKLVAGDSGARERLREWLIPANLDRTAVLESRADTLGRLLRLLTSVYHSRLNVTSGELLYAVCNHDGPCALTRFLLSLLMFCAKFSYDAHLTSGLWQCRRFPL